MPTPRVKMLPLITRYDDDERHDNVRRAVFAKEFVSSMAVSPVFYRKGVAVWLTKGPQWFVVRWLKNGDLEAKR